MVGIVSFNESEGKVWQHEATMSNGDLSDRVMLHGSSHHLHTGHHLAERTVKGASRFASRTDAKAMLVDHLAEWDEESCARFLAVTLSPLQVSQ